MVKRKHLALTAALLLSVAPAGAQQPPRTDTNPTRQPSTGVDPKAVATSAGIRIPRLATPPRLEDFLAMQPESPAARAMAHVSDFRQWIPYDGQPASEQTHAYLGYDNKNLYVVFVCFDRNRAGIRASLTQREQFFPNDFVDLWLDTFHDRRRGYEFVVNPLGVQADGLVTEGQGEDFSFDTLWYSRGQLTAEGYVVWMAIPFKSLRFRNADVQTWGIMLQRDINRNNEKSFWPTITKRQQGLLTQNAPLYGIENISPGRNLQFIPYGIARSFRALDTRDPAAPRFESRTAKFDGGVDAKLVIKDSLVLDLTAEPDFSQIESDEPQITVSERFEVFFPEKRPFFIENSNYFNTPIQLLFTRRIANPQFGARLTGKLGRWSLGALVSDDRAPGRRVPASDPAAGKRAYFAIGRVNRDIFKDSTAGVMFTDREFLGTFNRVGGGDAYLKLNKNWSAQLQAVASSTRLPDGSYFAGPAFQGQLLRSGRDWANSLDYEGRSTGFLTFTGFDPQNDVHRISNQFRYSFWPKSRAVLNWGPSVRVYRFYDNTATVIGWGYMPEMRFEMPRQTYLTLGYAEEEETLRPKDFAVLTRNREYVRNTKYVFFQTGPMRQLSLNLDYRWGRRINYVPPAGVEPFLAMRNSLTLGVTVRPLDRLQIDNSYLLFRLRDPSTRASAFNNHIIRSKWNYQFTRALSARVIVQYNSLLANPQFTALPTSKSVNADFLITYLLHPGTAVYVGYNSNLSNFDPSLTPVSDGLLRSRGSNLINDSRQFFVKVSYLLRF